jgi:hypothetical protein
MTPRKNNAPASLAAQTGHLQSSHAMSLVATILTRSDPATKLRQEFEGLRQQFGDWAPRSKIAAVLQKHEDTVARKCTRHNIQTRHALTPAGRCRVELRLADAERVFLCGGAKP